MGKLGLLLLTALAFAQTPLANLKQVMRAIPLPNSNIVFDVQGKAPKDEAEWKTVENAALAVAETATLIAMPGRLLENGQPVPVASADWKKFSQGLRAAGEACYRAAQSRKQDAVSDCTDQLTVSCSDCHDVYRRRTAPPPK